MEETLRPASHKPKASCDASTSMDEAALGAVLASLDSGKPATEDCSTITDTAPSVSSVGMNTTQSGSVGEVETNDQDVGSSGEAEDVFEDTDQEDEDEERGSLAGTPVFLDENNGIIKRLRMISEVCLIFVSFCCNILQRERDLKHILNQIILNLGSLVKVSESRIKGIDF